MQGRNFTLRWRIVNVEVIFLVKIETMMIIDGAKLKCDGLETKKRSLSGTKQDTIISNPCKEKIISQ